MPPSRRSGMTPPIVFDDAAWATDIRRASREARRIAERTRAVYERDGVPVAELRSCAAEGPDGTSLEHCVKVYLPPPVGPHGMVFRIARDRDGRLALAYIAFGLRHPTADMRQPSVYAVAHRRLHLVPAREGYDPRISLNSATIRDRRIERRRASASSRT